MEYFKWITRRGDKRPADADNESERSRTNSTIKTVKNTNCTQGVQQNIQGDIYNTFYSKILNIQASQEPNQEIHDLEFQVTEPVESFHGRQEELAFVSQAFQQPRDATLRSKLILVAVCGYGGMGKSEFARMFIKQNRTNLKNIIWISSEFQYNIKENFKKLQKTLNNKGYNCDTVQDVYKHLNNINTIFIFDNAENMRSLRGYLPDNSNESLFLVTSQSENWEPYTTKTLELLDAIPAADIVKANLNSFKIQCCESDLQEIVETFEGIPLVLQITAANICQKVCKLRKIGNSYTILNIIGELNRKCELVIREFPDFSSNLYHKESIFKAVLPTIDKIYNQKDEESLVAMKILGVSAYLNADYISKELLKLLVQSEDDDEYIFNDSLANLILFSLFQMNDGYINIHRTIQHCLRYYHEQKLKSNKYFELALSVFIVDDYYVNNEDFEENFDIIIEHSANYLNSFNQFYMENKCSQLHQIFAEHITEELILLLIQRKDLDLLQNPEFLNMLAVEAQDEIMVTLFNGNINFNICDEKGLCALNYACSEDIISVHKWYRIKLLLNYGSNINFQNSNADSALHILCRRYRNKEFIFATVATLIALGANHQLKNNNSQTPADLARKYSLHSTLELLDSFSPEKRNILFIAVQNKQFKFLQNLDQETFDVNRQDDSGNTVLHLLASLVHQDNDNEILNTIIHLIQWNHAQICLKNQFGETVKDVAQRCNRHKLVEILLCLSPQAGYSITTSTHGKKIEDFLSRNEENTSVRVLSDLQCDGATEDDIMKLVIELVVRRDAAVNATAAYVARRQGLLLLADFLDTYNTPDSQSYKQTFQDTSLLFALEFVTIVIKYKRFDLLRYMWWRYLYNINLELTYGSYATPGFVLLYLICSIKDSTITDVELIDLASCFDLKQVTKYKYSERPYCQVISIAKQHDRDDLAEWLEEGFDEDVYSDFDNYTQNSDITGYSTSSILKSITKPTRRTCSTGDLEDPI